MRPLPAKAASAAAEAHVGRPAGFAAAPAVRPAIHSGFSARARPAMAACVTGRFVRSGSRRCSGCSRGGCGSGSSGGDDGVKRRE